MIYSPVMTAPAFKHGKH